MSIRPRRSLLFMPGSNARAIEKARTLPADGIIIDLEDAVAPDAKAQARDRAVAAVRDGGFGSREVFIRVNAMETPWHADDLAAVSQAAPDGVLVPKVTTPRQIELIGQRLLDMHTEHRTHVWAMIETPIALFNIAALAAMARDSETRLTGFVMGTNDLAKETRARLVPGRAPMAPWLMNCIAAAHAYGIDILDGVYNGIGDADGFAAECAQARDMGFDGKTLIHPGQIDACNTAFSPSADEIAEARKTMAAFAQPGNKDKGVVQIGGRMVERMHADIAQRTVAIADAIAAKSCAGKS